MNSWALVVTEYTCDFHSHPQTNKDKRDKSEQPGVCSERDGCSQMQQKVLCECPTFVFNEIPETELNFAYTIFF